MKNLFILLLVILGVGSIKAQTKKFDIYFLGNKIGQMSIERKQLAGGIVQYFMHSTAKANVFFTETTSETNHSVTYKDGKLTDSYHSHAENKKIEYCKVAWDGKKYNILYQDGKFSIEGQATTSVATLYYKEPKNETNLFYEPDGKYCTLSSDGKGRYECKTPSGNRSVYYYTNGEITETEFHLSILSVKMKRVYD